MDAAARQRPRRKTLLSANPWPGRPKQWPAVVVGIGIDGSVPVRDENGRQHVKCVVCIPLLSYIKKA